jgi:hypothetical protein
MPPFREKLLFQGTFVIMPSRRVFGSKNINFGVFSPGRRFPKPSLNTNRQAAA